MSRKLHLALSCALLAGAIAACGESHGPTALARIDKDKQAYIGTAPFEAPLLFQENMEWAGPEAELGRQIAERLSQEIGEPVVPYWITRDHAKLEPDLLANGYDLIIAAYGITEERKQNMLFSDSYYDKELVLVTNPVATTDLSPATLSGRRIGVVEGTAIETFARAQFPDSTITPLDTVDNALLSLRSAEVDAVIADRLQAIYSLGTTAGMGSLEIWDEPLGTIPVAVAIRKNDPDLLEIVNEVVRGLDKGMHKRMAEARLAEFMAQVEERDEEREKREQAAQKPRRVTFTVARAGGSDFDIYRFANLRFQLVNAKTNERLTTSQIQFNGSTGSCSAQVPPGEYNLILTKFNIPVGNVGVFPSDEDRLRYNVRVSSDGTMTMRRAGS